jgi:serine phosphatase RsbU (regulator of sigma subunit)
MTIRTKVQIGFLLVLTMFIALCWFTINRTNLMYRHFHGLLEHTIPTLGISAEMSYVLDRLRVTESYHILEHDPNKMGALWAEIEKLQIQMHGLEAKYNAVITVPAQAAALDAMAADFETYLSAFDAWRALSEQNRTDEAFAALQASAPLYAKLLTRLTDLDLLAGELANNAGAEGEKAATDARNVAIGAVAVVAVFFLVLAVSTSRYILAPIRRLIAAIDRLAGGDLVTDVPLTQRRDELGDVGRALEQFRKNAVEKERLQKQERDDLEFARRIQLASVPRRFPAFPDRTDVDIAGRLLPTRAVGGDFFDFYLRDSNRLVIAIGDASGKGVASAMFVGMARSALKSESVRTAQPEVCLVEANRTIAADNESMMFMTTFFGVLHLDTGTLSFGNAGHTASYILSKQHGVRTLNAAPGVPLGVVDDFAFPRHSIDLSPGETIILYTDGVTEAAAVDESLFGEERLEEVLARYAGETCAAIVDGVFTAVQEFSKGAPQSDDIAILAVRYNGASLLADIATTSEAKQF